MSKTIKVIDLLNKIANGEEIPEKIKWKGIEFDYDKDLEDYCEGSYCSLLYKMVGGHRGLDILDYEVEIIEEQEEIDIQNIKELNEEVAYYSKTFDTSMGRITEKNIANTWTTVEKEIVKQQNEILQAVKQLDKKIKEK